jgi:hypothetical protein
MGVEGEGRVRRRKRKGDLLLSGRTKAGASCIESGERVWIVCGRKGRKEEVGLASVDVEGEERSLKFREQG